MKNMHEMKCLCVFISSAEKMVSVVTDRSYGKIFQQHKGFWRKEKTSFKKMAAIHARVMMLGWRLWMMFFSATTGFPCMWIVLSFIGFEIFVYKDFNVFHSVIQHM